MCSVYVYTFLQHTKGLQQRTDMDSRLHYPVSHKIVWTAEDELAPKAFRRDDRWQTLQTWAPFEPTIYASATIPLPAPAALSPPAAPPPE